MSHKISVDNGSCIKDLVPAVELYIKRKRLAEHIDWLESESFGFTIPNQHSCLDSEMKIGTLVTDGKVTLHLKQDNKKCILHPLNVDDQCFEVSQRKLDAKKTCYFELSTVDGETFAFYAKKFRRT